MYSGVRRRIRGICSREYMVAHCRGHVDAATCTNADDAYLAIGNGHADRLAGAVAAKTPLPSQGEF
jgi:phosphoribosylcarboxyaminoimidazole (NCAIR) mutase